MRLIEMFQLKEGVTFSASPFNPETNTWEMDATRKEVDCIACDGTGVDTWGGETHPCMYCNGQKREMQWVANGPELDVSNANAYTVCDLLGVDARSNGELVGSIDAKDIPAAKRALMAAKNRRLDRYTQEPTQRQRPMGMSRDENGMSRIGPQGPQMFDMGRTEDQVIRYIETLEKILDYAQSKGYGISWA